MENEILFNIQNITLEIALMSLIVFGLTMLIKIPIKRATSKLEETKRKSYNTLIILIPIVLSILACFIYYGIDGKSNWTDLALRNSMTVYILAAFIYAVYQRIVIVIRGMKSKDTKINSTLPQDVVKYLKQNIKLINHTIKDEEKGLLNLSKQLKYLQDAKMKVENNPTLQSITPLNELDESVAKLKREQDERTNAILDVKNTLKKYEEELHKK